MNLNWGAHINERIETILKNNQWRQTVAVDNDNYLVFASNDYLGLKSHPKVIESVCKAVANEMGTGGSRLITGSRQLHRDLEDKLADYKQQEAGLVFSSGYTANIGVISTLGTKEVTILSDELNHASIVDGCRLAKSEVLKYRHLDLEHLRSLLKDVNQTGNLSLVVTDSVFSMDGDVADINELAQMCSTYGAFLVIDDAHNVFNRHFECDPELSLIVGTLSKTFGSLGGFIVGQRNMIDLMINKSRSFIFTTGLSNADTAAAIAGVDIVMSSEGDQLLEQLSCNIKYFKELMAIDSDFITPIVPIVIGSEDRALKISAKLKENHILVPAIRPPTVPKNTSRLRITLSSQHERGQLELLSSILKDALGRF